MVSNTTVPVQQPASPAGKPEDYGVGHFQPLTELLRCLRCNGQLDLRESGFACRKCSATFPITNGVLRFVESQGYAENFGFEWSKYARTQLDNEVSQLSERQLLEYTGFNPDQLSGKWVLDVGCGMGRFAEVASRWGAKVVGIDLSLAADVAAKNLSARENVWICQASVLA